MYTFYVTVSMPLTICLSMDHRILAVCSWLGCFENQESTELAHRLLSLYHIPSSWL